MAMPETAVNEDRHLISDLTDIYRLSAHIETRLKELDEAVAA